VGRHELEQLGGLEAFRLVAREVRIAVKLQLARPRTFAEIKLT